jgi:hypothetical protein
MLQLGIGTGNSINHKINLHEKRPLTICPRFLKHAVVDGHVHADLAMSARRCVSQCMGKSNYTENWICIMYHMTIQPTKLF